MDDSNEQVTENSAEQNVIVLLIIAAVAVAYILSGRLGLLLAQNQTAATLIWVPTGLSLAALILWGRRIWPAVFLGALGVNFMVGSPAYSAYGIAVGNTLEAVTGAWLLSNVVSFDPGFSRLRDVWMFLSFGVIVSPIVSASIGVLSVAAAGEIGATSPSALWLDWWLGDAGGALVFAPLVMIAFRGRPDWSSLARRYETSLVFTLTIVAAAVPFAGMIPEEWQLLGTFLPFPLIAWAGLRLGPRGAVITSTLTSVIAILGTAQDIGPFRGDAGLYLTWAYMTVMGISALTLAATVAEREDADQQREKLDAELQNAQRLDSVGMLAGGIAHDFNNLLMPILGNAELLRDYDVKPEERRKMLDNIAASAESASELCKLLLTYAGRGKPVIEPVDVVALVTDTVTLLESSKSSNVQLRIEVDGNIPKVEGDPTQLRQIFLNLIVNATEASGDSGGIVTIRFFVEAHQREYLESTYLHSTAEPGTFVTVEVIDDGEGMNQETLERVFDAFFSTKSGGRGLGMAMVQRIVRLHGGAIKVESEFGRGTSFRVLLRPCADANPEQLVAPVTKPGKTGLILVIDDDSHVRETTERMLAQIGYDAVSVADGRTGLGYVKDHAEEISLVLLDVLMPEIDGKETLMAMRKIRPDLPVVFMSGFDEAKLDDLANHSFGFLHKPFTLSTLSTAIGDGTEIDTTT